MLLIYKLTFGHLGNVWLLQRKVLALFFVVFAFFLIGSLMYSAPMTAIVSGFNF